MAKIVTVGSQTFTLPSQGDSIGYAEEVLAFQEAVANALLSVQGPNDIPSTTATIANNQTTKQPIIGFSHNKINTRSFKAEYSIDITYNSGTKAIESGTIEGNNDGTTWFIMIESAGNSGIVLSINDSTGQMEYTSPNFTAYTSGNIKFKSKSIDV